MPGWEKFEGGGVELWLPESYEGGDLSQDVELIVENLRRQGPDFEQMAKVIEQNPSMYVLWAVDLEVGDSGFLTNVAVTTEKVLSALTLEAYIDAAVKQFPEQLRLIERDAVSLGSYQSGRLILEFTISGVVVKQVLYVIKEGNTVWVMTFATGLEEFDQRLPSFERIARTFTVQD